MTAPLITICLPNLNTRPFLEERMETILAQTVTDWELIICDSYSDDGSWEFFQKFKGDPRIRMYQVPREGVYAGWNECLRRARGEYCYIATSDDTMSPVCLEKLLKPLAGQPELKIALCEFQEIDERGEVLKSNPKPVNEFLGEWKNIASIRNSRAEFLIHAAFGGTTWGTLNRVLFRRSLLLQTGLFRTDLGSQADEEWTLRATLASNVAFIPELLVAWRVHANQATQRNKPRQAASTVLTAIRTVLHDCQSGFPPEWKQIPNWEQELTLAHRWNYRQTFPLYRWEARRNPRRFLNAIVSAVRHDPAWLAAQVGHAFGLSESRKFHPGRHARRLLDLFVAPWPPQALTAG